MGLSSAIRIFIPSNLLFVDDVSFLIRVATFVPFVEKMLDIVVLKSSERNGFDKQAMAPHSYNAFNTSGSDVLTMASIAWLAWR